MTMFKVTVEKPLGIYGGTGRPLNPFGGFDIFNPLLRCKKAIREFQFEAKDEAEVRWYFDEAVKADTAQIRGYTLCSIEEVK